MARCMLFGMTIVAAVTMHDFWHYADAGARAQQFGIFARDFAICGGLLLMVGWGRGRLRWTIAEQGRRR